jgi:signal transduction histidine kinase/ActR/RegA family two-component response regulator
MPRAACLQTIKIVPERIKPQLGRLIAVPMATIGALAAILVWELEHVGSILLAVVVLASAVVAALVVVRRVRRRVDDLGAHYEALLRTADEQSQRAEAANRLKDEFLATLSHELRTPLNSVLGWARLLATGRLDADQTTKAVQAIERAGWAQSRLVEDLLDVSRIVSGKLQIALRPTLLQPLVDAAVQSLAAATEAKRLAVRTELDAEVGPIAVDPERLQQVVWNLVSNAIKFTPSGGHVDVRLARDAHHVRLAVSDSGIGFKPEIAAHLFERFRQGDSGTTRQFGGLGLGLGIVRHLVELHGGTVTAESSGENRGSVFTVCLPIVEASVAATKAHPTAPAPALAGVNVLVVDDNPQDLEFARSTLEQYGASVMIASSVAEARERFTSRAPHVILSDLRMPDGDGLDLIREVRLLDEQRGRRTPAAALTGLARSDDRNRALAAGYQMHVVKPIDPFELALAVERLARSESNADNRAVS